MTDPRSSQNPLENQAAHCSRCGQAYDLNPLVEKTIDN